MFNEKMLGNLVLANLVIAVAVLLMSVTIVVKGFAPSAAVADNDAPAVAQAQPQPAVDNEAISKKYAKRSMSLEKAIAKRKPVAVLFFADWCGFCKRFSPTFAELSKDKDLKKKYTFVWVNSEDPENRKYMQQYQVTGFPTLYLVNPNTLDKAHVSNGLMFGADPVGTMKEQFEKFLEEGSSGVTQPEAPKAEDDKE
ncbi:MAG: protein disulfide isomerase family protein [Candidatus Gastranaerophilales bacterium]|nr:protein disulfide isomerase family protein [Candidatus Gastranaerophilales bacterium]